MADEYPSQGDKQARAEQPDKQKLFESKKKSFESWAKYISLIAGLLTGVFALGTLITGKLPETTKNDTTQLQTKMYMSRIDDINMQLVKTQRDLEELRNNIQDVSKNPDAATALQLKGINNSLTETQNKLSSLEQVILDNPTKALAIPLLRKDLDDMKAAQQNNAVSIKEQIDRIYDLNKWFLGLMITSSVAIIGLAISNLFKKPSS